MHIQQVPQSSRLWLNELQDAPDRSKHQGFKKETGFKGWLYNLIGLAFKDPAVSDGYLNKKSVIHYLQRISKKLDPNDPRKNEIAALKDSSRVSKVKNVFNSTKNSHFTPSASQSSAPAASQSSAPVVPTLPVITRNSEEVKGSALELVNEGKYAEAARLIEKEMRSEQGRMLALTFDKLATVQQERQKAGELTPLANLRLQCLAMGLIEKVVVQPNMAATQSADLGTTSHAGVLKLQQDIIDSIQKNFHNAITSTLEYLTLPVPKKLPEHRNFIAETINLAKDGFVSSQGALDALLTSSSYRENGSEVNYSTRFNQFMNPVWDLAIELSNQNENELRTRLNLPIQTDTVQKPLKNTPINTELAELSKPVLLQINAPDVENAKLKETIELKFLGQSIKMTGEVYVKELSACIDDLEKLRKDFVENHVVNAAKRRYFTGLIGSFSEKLMELKAYLAVAEEKIPLDKESLSNAIQVYALQQANNKRMDDIYYSLNM